VRLLKHVTTLSADSFFKKYRLLKSKTANDADDETFDKIQERNNAEVKNLQSYKELKHTVQRMLREDKEKQLNDKLMCEELQKANAKGDMRKLFQQVRSLTSTFKPKLHCVESAERETDKIAERWREYCEDLYKDKDTS